jgi:hypothetical protein
MAVSRIIQKFKGKKRKSQKVDFKKDSLSYHHDCSDCSAECMLRNAAKPVIKENAHLCNKIESQANLKG